MNASHDHVFLGADHKENAKRTLWVVILTVLMMVGEIAAGYITRIGRTPRRRYHHRPPRLARRPPGPRRHRQRGRGGAGWRRRNSRAAAAGT